MLLLLMMVMVPVLMSMLKMTGLLQDVIGRRIRIFFFIMSWRMRGELVLLNLRLIVQGFVRRRQLMEVVRGAADRYLIFGLVVVVVMVVMTRGLMMKLLLVFRS